MRKWIAYLVRSKNKNKERETNKNLYWYLRFEKFELNFIRKTGTIKYDNLVLVFLNSYRKIESGFVFLSSSFFFFVCSLSPKRTNVFLFYFFSPVNHVCVKRLVRCIYRQWCLGLSYNFKIFSGCIFTLVFFLFFSGGSVICKQDLFFHHTT